MLPHLLFSEPIFEVILDEDGIISLSNNVSTLNKIF